jgi:hypothetical protein
LFVVWGGNQQYCLLTVIGAKIYKNIESCKYFRMKSHDELLHCLKFCIHADFKAMVDELHREKKGATDKPCGEDLSVASVFL